MQHLNMLPDTYHCALWMQSGHACAELMQLDTLGFMQFQQVLQL